MITVQNYINGKLVNSLNNQWIEGFNPASENINSQIPNSSFEDIDLAINAAKENFPNWSKLSIKKRGKYLLTIANLIKENAEELAQLETNDTGKPIQLSRSVDIPRSATNLEFFANHALTFNDFELKMEKANNIITRNSLGVVGCISPWNLPLYLFTWKIAPALITGNTVIAKPSEITPLTAHFFSKLCIEAKLPPGVLNIVHGLGNYAGSSLINHDEIKAISFTGSTATGKIIAQAVAPKFKKLSLEMGGKNPFIIFADSDHNKASKTAVKAAFTNQGQICLCGSRIFIEKNIYQEMKEKIIKETNALVCGNPTDDKTNIGAIVSKEHFNKIMNHIEIAKTEGGIILTGGESYKIADKGYFIKPTLIENLDPYCQTNQEEIFGPVATLTPFDSEKEVISWANSTDYGLAGSIFTNDLSKAKRVASQIESGIIWINTWLLRDLRTPFGGMKNSGVGREGGDWGLNFFTETKNICIKKEDT